MNEKDTLSGRSEQLVTVFRALDDEVRIRILEELKNKECCFSELKATLGIPQPRLSYHLKILNTSGLISIRQDGKNKYYSINHGGRDRALRMLLELTSSFGE